MKGQPEDRETTANSEVLGSPDDLFWAVFNSAPVGMFIVQDGRFQAVNPQFQSDTGYDEEDLIGMDSLGLVLPEDRDQVRESAVARLRTQGHTPYEYRIVNRRGEVRWILGTLTSMQYRGRRAVVGYYMDISDRKEAERELEEVNRGMKPHLEVASRLQKALLPPVVTTELAGVNVTWALEPCQELAGDTLDFFLIDDQHIGLYILDVSGHGLVAAMLSVTLHRALSPFPQKSSLLEQPLKGSSFRPPPPAQLAEELNEKSLMDPALPQYFTLIYGILNVPSRRFQYLCAGHPGPVCVSLEGVATLLETEGFPIGLLPQARYEEHSLDLEPGQRLYLYSDGITETTDRQKREFGQWRLREVLAEHRHLPLDETVSVLLEEVKEWKGNAPHTDDLSIIAVEVG